MAATETEATGLPARFDSVRVGRIMRRLGAIGFWAQLFVAIIPVVVITIAFAMVYGVQTPTRTGGLLGLLSLTGFVILLLTTYWCWRYRKIGADLSAGGTPKAARLEGMVWTGLGLTAAGIVVSVLVLVFEMAYLLILFLEAPQGGVPVIQTTDGDTGWISAVDILSLMTVVLTLTAEIVVLVVTLWILSRITLRREAVAA